MFEFFFLENETIAIGMKVALKLKGRTEQD